MSYKQISFLMGLLGILSGQCPQFFCGTAPSRAEQPRIPRHLALLVGVGHHLQEQRRPRGTPWPRLSVRREVQQYREVLIRDYGFAEADVMVLFDEKATKETIGRAFATHLIKQAQPGDVVLFHFSGYGQQLPDDPDPRLADEPDGLDESLVPYDATDQSIQEGMAKNISDDELVKWLDKLADKMRPIRQKPMVGNITVTLDTCYWGTAARSLLIPRGRGWDTRTDGPRPPLRPDLPEEGGGGILARPLQDGIVVVSAATMDQTAWEGEGQGLFTRHFVHLLASAGANQLTYREIVDRVTMLLQAEVPIQTPQIEGQAALQLFSDYASSRDSADLLTRRPPSGFLWLSRGQLHDVTLGSRYRLFVPGLPPDYAPALLGESEVSRLDPYAAQLQPLSGVRLGEHSLVHAAEIEHAYDLDKLRLTLFGCERMPAVSKALTQLGIVEQVAESRAMLALHCQTDPDRVTLLWPDGTSSAAIPVDPALATTLQGSLQAQWRRMQLYRLHHETPGVAIRLELLPTLHAVGPELKPRQGHLSLPPVDVPPKVRRGSELRISLHNRSARAQYIAVLAVCSDGRLELVSSEQDEKPLPSWRLREFSVAAPHCKPSIQPDERILIKAIATDEFIDFSAVDQSRATAAKQGGATPLPNPLSPTDAPIRRLLESIGAGVDPGRIRIPVEIWRTADAFMFLQ